MTLSSWSPCLWVTNVYYILGPRELVLWQTHKREEYLPSYLESIYPRSLSSLLGGCEEWKVQNRESRRAWRLDSPGQCCDVLAGGRQRPATQHPREGADANNRSTCLKAQPVSNVAPAARIAAPGSRCGTLFFPLISNPQHYLPSTPWLDCNSVFSLQKSLNPAPRAPWPCHHFCLSYHTQSISWTATKLNCDFYHFLFFHQALKFDLRHHPNGVS